MTPIYNWLICPRCKRFKVEVKESGEWKLLCQGQPLAMTGDTAGNHVGNCPDFDPSGKRGFDTRKEGHGGKRKQKVKQEKPTKKNQVQHGKSRAEKSNQKTQKTLGPLFQ